jgi:hypothetical protein
MLMAQGSRGSVRFGFTCTVAETFPLVTVDATRPDRFLFLARPVGRPSSVGMEVDFIGNLSFASLARTPSARSASIGINSAVIVSVSSVERSERRKICGDIASFCGAEMPASAIFGRSSICLGHALQPPGDLSH